MVSNHPACVVNCEGEGKVNLRSWQKQWMPKGKMEEYAYTKHSTTEVASILLHILLGQRKYRHIGKYTCVSFRKKSLHGFQKGY